MAKVYCVTEPISYKDGEPVPLFDISGALKFGELVTLAKHSHSIISSVPLVRMLREKMKDFNDDDYILPIGDPAIIGTVCAVASDINNGFYRILKWDKRSKNYLPVAVDVYGNEV